MNFTRHALLPLLAGLPLLSFACGPEDSSNESTILINPASAGGNQSSSGAGGAEASSGQGGASPASGSGGSTGGNSPASGAGGQTAGTSAAGGMAAGTAGTSAGDGGAISAGAGGAGSNAAGTGAAGAETAGAPGAGGSGGGANDCPRVKIDVAAGATLNVRPTPSTTEPAVGKLNDGDIVDVLEQVQGEAVGGNTLWFHIQAPSVTGYVSGVYAACTLEEPPVITPPDGFYLPLECGKSAKIAQGNNGGFSHTGKALYAYDFSIGLNTPMVAMADGTVAYTYDKTGPGDPCYNGGDSSCFPHANYVVLKHGDGSLSTYKHLNKVNVSVGQLIKRGTVIGLSGSTGYSTGPHAHVMRMEDCGQYSCQSIPLKFVDVGGDHVPDTGELVTSGNCP